ncbi:hypothetical protein OPV22_010653 [Ensete ventricosum]|uniref:Uncharacterized protein n=1 Tax=Ensete ventricosum TaxID=4639 RepID=A0AAV8RBS4_ENSVE|nr:hypothetical protein OPV22_010653 [Ensete ventricosum]
MAPVSVRPSSVSATGSRQLLGRRLRGQFDAVAEPAEMASLTGSQSSSTVSTTPQDRVNAVPFPPSLPVTSINPEGDFSTTQQHSFTTPNYQCAVRNFIFSR